MRATVRKFARFYYPEFQRDYSDIYADDVAFSAWMRLLVTAEQAWPAKPELPRSIRPKALRLLTSSRDDRSPLVVVNGHTFAIKGFAVERARRHDAALAGAGARWDADADAGAPPTAPANGHATADPRAMPSTRTSTSTKTKQGRRSVDGADADGLVESSGKTA